ncbi:MAG TPA: hypothetical protein PLV87_05955, partial [Opitutaceae bacterium]|nr:hypothetical protein [Opitutaceae bacterium]
MITDSPREHLCQLTRRHFFSRCSVGLGGIALASLLGRSSLSAATPASQSGSTTRPPHFKPRAKNVIYLFMAGGP